jgi:hypothetical protein
MSRVILSGAIGVASLLALLALRVDAREKNADTPQKPHVKWEYKTLDCYKPKELDQLGEEGWEMVAVTTIVNKWDFGFSTPGSYGGNPPKLSESTGASGSMTGYGNCLMYFKRQK